MLCEADIKVSWRARPRGFVALMSLYESNYLRFLHLAGDPTRLSGTLISRVDGDCELRLTVLEHMPYTSMLTLSYLLPSGDSGAFERLPEARPARMAVKLGLRGEQGQFASRAGERSGSRLMVKRTAKGPLRSLLSEHLVLVRRQQSAPFRIGMCNFKVIGRL